MNKLNEAICYLSGAIDKAADFGCSWREEFIKKAKHLRMDNINPCNKPASFVHEVVGDVRTVSKFREEKDWVGLREFVKKFRHEDLRFVDISDLVVVYIDPEIPSYGTLDEIFIASRQKKPLFCIIKGGIECLPTWLFATFRLDEIFATIDECIDHLTKIDNGQIPMDMRWVLVRKELRQQTLSLEQRDVNNCVIENSWLPKNPS